MKSVGRGPLGRGEAGVKVGDDDLGQMTSKSGEKTFLSRDEIFHVQSRGCESLFSKLLIKSMINCKSKTCVIFKD